MFALALFALRLVAAGPAAAGGIFLTDSPEDADLWVYIVTDSDDASEVECRVNQDDIDATLQPNDLKLYVTKDADAPATWIAITDAEDADPIECLKSE